MNNTNANKHTLNIINIQLLAKHFLYIDERTS